MKCGFLADFICRDNDYSEIVSWGNYWGLIQDTPCNEVVFLRGFIFEDDKIIKGSLIYSVKYTVFNEEGSLDYDVAFFEEKEKAESFVQEIQKMGV